MTDQPILDSFIGTDSLKKAMELYGCLTTQLFSTKDLNVLPRTVVSWENEGLIDIKRGNKAEWRRLSFIEYLWIEFVNRMREIGLRLPIITKVKGILLSPMPLEWIIEVLKSHPEKTSRLRGEELREILSLLEKQNLGNAEVTVFMLLAISCIIERKPVSIVIFMDGTALPWFGAENPHWSEGMLLRKTQEIHISIPILYIFRDFLSNPKTLFALPKLKLLSEGEEFLMDKIQSGGYSSITINFKDQKLKSLELVKEQDVKKKITEVLADASYQDITIKTHKGMITKIENTVKVMF